MLNGPVPAQEASVMQEAPTIEEIKAGYITLQKSYWKYEDWESRRNSLFARDVIDILKCKIAEPLSFQLSLVIEHPKYISF